MIYLINLLANIREALAVLIALVGVASLFSFVVSFFSHMNYEDETADRFMKYGKRFAISTILLILLWGVIPDRITMYLMFGEGVFPDVLESPEVDGIREFLKGLGE